MTSAEKTRLRLARWRTARRVVLGSLVLAGSVATSAAVMYRMAHHDCGAAYQQVNRSYTYSGIGVVIEREGEHVVVRRVLPGAPAEDALFPGARLVAVDGDVPPTLEHWAASIRGPAGSDVDLEVAYPCGGHKTIAITRDVIHMQY